MASSADKQTKGHDFVVLGRSPDGAASGAPEYLFSASDVASLKGSNPLRRDVTMLPPRGWIAIAFKTDNPGAWLLYAFPFPSLPNLPTSRPLWIVNDLRLTPFFLSGTATSPGTHPGASASLSSRARTTSALGRVRATSMPSTHNASTGTTGTRRRRSSRTTRVSDIPDSRALHLPKHLLVSHRHFAYNFVHNSLDACLPVILPGEGLEIEILTL